MTSPQKLRENKYDPILYQEDCLSFNQHYELKKSLSELQKSDELELINNIERMNESLKQKIISQDSPFNSTQFSNNSVELLSDNFYAYDKVIKIMLMGNKGVGKTILLTSLLNLLNNDKDEIQTKPTLSLEISKKIYKLRDNLINLEFWDTNEQILLSPIIKSIFILTQLILNYVIHL
jgi:DNA replication protein DnaC